jgi:tryptophan synthase alpha chain
VARIRAISSVPVCVGFGISTPEQVAEIGRFSDGAVVGSALVDRLEAAATPGSAVTSVSEFVAELKRALR